MLTPPKRVDVDRAIQPWAALTHRHYPPVPINIADFSDGIPLVAPYHQPSMSYRVSSDAVGLLSHDQVVSRKSRSRGDSPYESRDLGHSDADQTSLRGSPPDYHLLALAGTSASGQTDQYPADVSPSQLVAGAKYECHYCGKGFNRPSSLKVKFLSLSRCLLSR